MCTYRIEDTFYNLINMYQFHQTSIECQEALGMENGAISDEQIRFSSQLDANHYAVQGRLHWEAGSWSASSNDVHQWLQIDLGSQYTKMTGVATQGRSDAAQWVTRYKLQYSNNGVNFQYYREQGQTADRVKYIYSPKWFSFRLFPGSTHEYKSSLLFSNHFHHDLL